MPRLTALAGGTVEGALDVLRDGGCCKTSPVGLSIKPVSDRLH
jgi:hypothetical protein